MNARAFLSISSLAVFLMGCQGFSSRSGAPLFDPAGLVVDASECHYTTYQTNLASVVTNQCVACHGTPGNGSLLLSTGTADADNLKNYGLISQYIETTSASPDDTTLIGKIAGGLSHPIKLGAGSGALSAFLDFTQEILDDPTCTATDGSI